MTTTKFKETEVVPLSPEYHIMTISEDGKTLTKWIDSANTTIVDLTQFTKLGQITQIGSEAFKGQKNITSVTLPNTVTAIGVFAFKDCSSLASITIPDSVTAIGEGAFLECSSLTTIP